MAKVGIFGAGWVGLVTGACFAELGHEVVVRDVVPEKIEALRRGEVPFHEERVPDLLAANGERLTFTLDVNDVADCEFLFVCVDTPPTYSGDADLSRVWTVVDELPDLDGRPILVMKSTVPVGTGEKVRVGLDQRGLDHVGYVSNPEFLAEGRAVEDFMNPDRIVIGAFAADDADAVARLYDSLDAPVLRTDVNSAEMIKLAANAFLMTRISFINEIANVCEATGADVVAVAEGVGLDKRLGPHFLRAGIGYGGSCLAGEETVVVRLAGRSFLIPLKLLYDELDGQPPLPLEALAWDEKTGQACFAPVAAVTRRESPGAIVELRTKMGRRLRCTPDHPLVTRRGIVAAGDLTTGDWLPLAQGLSGTVSEHPVLDVLEGLAVAGAEGADVIVRAPAIADLSPEEMRERLPDASASRRMDIRRRRAPRLSEARTLNISLEQSSVGTARNGAYVPVELAPDERFWRIVGLYVAAGHCSADGRRRRLQWSFHPRREEDLVEEVRSFWSDYGVKASVVRRQTTACVVVSSRVLAAWWLGVLGLGANRYEQRVPDFIWDAPLSHKRSFLSGLWRGDGSCSYVNRGASVVLEYGTASHELADGVVRLLADLAVVARMKVGRTAKSTVDTYWIVVSGAQQVESLVELVSPSRRAAVERAVAQTTRIAPTGFQRGGGTAWVRVVEATRRTHSGFVYSLEVPGAETFVTTGGLVCHNCFPKDSLALKQLASNSGYHFQLLSAVIEVNELQKRRVIGKLKRHLGPLRGKTVALLGLPFKPNTDDMREAPSIVLASRLLAEGADVRAWDPVVRDADKLPKGVDMVGSIVDAVRGADAAVIVTEWPELKELASTEVREAMATPLIVDGRNLLDPEAARRAGFTYEGIGRSAAPRDVVPQTPPPATRTT
ncbi:MAG TPA: nucleotide sugar dehydrogenase [Gaiellaceae bacterium]|nr:nucleotide sugar dehydrogenase [Gaiellaceae bacterium]